MKKSIQMTAVVTLATLALSVAALAQGDGKATYTAKCASCHGAAGLADSGAGKMLKVPAATDPAVKALNAAAMITITTDGKGKMPAYKEKLSAAEIKAAVEYYRTFVK